MDMFNHKVLCKHYLTGRIDGQLRLVAGEPIATGEQVYIKYGTETTSNAELLGNYGFVDPGFRATSSFQGGRECSRDGVTHVAALGAKGQVP